MEAPLASDPAEVYDQIFRLERNLLAASKSKGPFDPTVRRLRISIRDGYEDLVLRNLALCEAFEVEQALWRLHYREIEGFRIRIRKLLSSRSPADDNAATAERRKKRKKENKQEPLLRALTSFRSFLGEASGFFHGLLIKLRLQHGLTTSFGNTDRLSAEGDVTEELRRCMVTCHRILIYLGDLARYKELYAVMDASVRDWSVAANYYKQAAVLWPSSGNPYNQLAVLCTYCANGLTALYLYCRSLAVSVPFETAWDNVVLLFEKNKQTLTQISLSGYDCERKIRWETTLPTNLHGFVMEQDLWLIHRVSRLQGWFIMHFIELVRVLLVQSSADELDKALDATEGKMKQFLDDAVNDTKASNKLAVVVILMEWLACQPKALQITCIEKEVAPMFSDLCEGVIALDSSIARKDEVDDLEPSMREGDFPRLADRAQWEDHELLGFVPLAASHLRLDFSMQLPGYGVLDLATYSCWKLRYTDALRKSWDAFGQMSSGCLLKLPNLCQINLATEESNPIPSLKEWIEKTFFSADVLTDFAHARQVEVQANGKDVVLHDLRAEMVMLSGEDEVGQCKDAEEPVAMEGQEVLAETVVKLDGNISTMAGSVSVERALDINVTKASSSIDQDERSGSLVQKLPHRDRDATVRGLSRNHTGLIPHSHEQQAMPSHALCLDSITHVKPQVLVEAFLTSRLNPSNRNSTAIRLKRPLTWENTPYETQNPFVVRLRKLS